MTTKPHIRRDPGVEHAIAAAGGTFGALAKILGISARTIAAWPQVPAERVLQIERLVRGSDRHVMRADLYPRERT